MTEHLPPPEVSRLPPLRRTHLRILAQGTLLGRIYPAAGAHPTSWDTFRAVGPTTARFDHHRGGIPSLDAERGILYAVPAVRTPRRMPVLRTCLSECFAERGLVEPARDQAYFVLFRLVRPVRLLDVIDSTWITRAGGNAAICSGPRERARQWSRAIYDHYTGADAVDGIFYGCASIPDARAVALYERARDGLPARAAQHRPLDDPVLRAELEVYADELGLDLTP